MLKSVTDGEAGQARLGSFNPFTGLGEPEDIAKVAVSLASDDASWVTGVALPVDGKSFPNSFHVQGLADLLVVRWLRRSVMPPIFHVS